MEGSRGTVALRSVRPEREASSGAGTIAANACGPVLLAPPRQTAFPPPSPVSVQNAMPTPTFTFEVTATDNTVTAFTVASFEGEERISQPFEYRLTLRHGNAALDFSKVVNQAAVLTMEQDALVKPLDDSNPAVPPIPAEYDPTRVKVEGIVASFRITRQFDDGDVECEALLVPKLWRLRMSQGSQVFQELTVQDIVETMLATELEAADYEFRLTETYLKREFCMQYQESNLDFVQRLLEHEGIYYYFDDGKLVFSDSRTAEPEVAGRKQVTFGEGTGAMTPADDQVYRFVYNEQIVPRKVLVKDYDFETFEGEEDKDQSTDVATSGGDYARVGTQYEHGRYAVDGKGWAKKESDDDAKDEGKDPIASSSTSRDAQMKRIALLRAQELEARRQTVEATSTASRLQAGHILELKGHFRFDGDYLVTEVHHTFDGTTYRNTFFCLPATVQFRPRRATPVPRVPGIMTARVKGTSADDPAYIDDEGRYRVRFPFDPNAASAGEPSRPIRLAQPYAGKDYGMHFPNRADAEMVFACLDGDPDRPLGLSVVPTPWKHSPVPNTKLKLGSQNPTTGSATGDDTTFLNTKNVIRTQRGHQLVMDDDDASANVGVTLQAGSSENVRSTGSVVDTYWGSKIELGGYRHLSALERVLGIASTAIGYFRSVFTRDFPGMASQALGIIASQVTTDDYVDDTFGNTTPVGINMYTNKNVNVTGKDGVNITSPNLFGMFSTSLMPGKDAGKHQYWAEAISKFLVNVIWQEIMNGTADELMDTRDKAKKYKANKYKNPKTQAAFKWQENVKDQRISALIFTLLQRTGVNISSMGELKMASLQSTSVAAGQGGLALKSFGGIEQKADLDIDIAAHQGVKISSKGVPYKGKGIIKALDKLADKVLPMKGLIATIQTKVSNVTLDPAEKFKIELENEKGDIFLHTGSDGAGDIMAHVEGSGDFKAFANEGDIHAWSGDKGITLEVGSRDGLSGDAALEPLSANKAKGRLVMDANTLHGYSAKNIQFAVASSYEKDDSAITIKDGSILIACGQSSIELKKNGDITIKGKKIVQQATTDVEIKGNNIKTDAQVNNTVEGLNVKVKGEVGADFEGTMTTLKGSAMTTVKGSLVKVGS